LTTTTLRSRFVRAVYATHNDSPAVRQAVARCLGRLGSAGRGLNVGAGDTRLHERVVNLDMAPAASVDCVGRAEQLPFPAGAFSVVLTQETLEHVADPWTAVAEIHRVLEPGGTLYCQLPFVIGYHPGPTDYWRFTVEGIRTLVESAGFTCEQIRQSVGAGTGMYRIAVEFVATLLSALSPRLYLPSKGVAAIVLAPLKLLDPVSARSSEPDRIPGGYFVIATRP
jgi:SAM-dependent methyltransferase